MAAVPSTHPYQLLDIDERVKEVLKTTPLFDGHNDLPQQPQAIFYGKIHNNPKFDIEAGFERGMTDIRQLREGMIIDLSHVSEDCTNQVFDITKAPVMYSHSNSKPMFDCPRNVPDWVLDRVPANGGIVMVTFVLEHVSVERKDATMEMVLDHLFYIAGRIGWDHVSLGSDFDGIASVIPGLEDVKCYPVLMKAFLDRGATQEQLAKCIGENTIRVWKGVVKMRDQMTKEGVLPIEDVWEGRQWWRYDGYYQMPDLDPEDKLGYDWYGVPRLEED
ncbi:hypothetical protein G7Y89_g9215 [Cudoniella acicularis]|uniref:Dipeptidase n=1 Tax=Cudoniella acicularis TaxID=354080 RepID=A0A8H4W2T5_9HELO|nr:hypothetical protein G7Y89_g9215 [Cudoniella acicularis]